MPQEPRTPPSGILLVDKPQGCTSHDVVAWGRRALGTREVGHAGTLDPAATGVLVLLVGDATRLSGFVTGQDKSYDAVVRFGVETDSLDADGVATREAPCEFTERALREALQRMIGPMRQVPPAVSAVKIGGVAAHERTRRGEAVALPPRDVTLCAATISKFERPDLWLSLTGSKGFYVRAFARDLAAELGSVAHLRALQRTRSGCFSLDACLPGETLRAARSDDHARQAVREALAPIESLEGRVPSVRLGLDAARDLRAGRTAEPPEGCPEGVVLALLERDASGLPPRAIGLARRDGARLRAERNLPDQRFADLFGKIPADARLE